MRVLVLRSISFTPRCQSGIRPSFSLNRMKHHQINTVLRASLSLVGIDIIPISAEQGVSPDLRSRDCAKSSRRNHDTSGVASVGIGVQQLTWLRSIVFCYAEHRCYASSSSSTRSGAIRTSTTPRQRPGAVCLDHGAQTQPEDAQPHGELPLFDCLCFSRIRRTANPERDPFSAPHAPAFGATS